MKCNLQGFFSRPNPINLTTALLNIWQESYKSSSDWRNALLYCIHKLNPPPPERWVGDSEVLDSYLPAAIGHIIKDCRKMIAGLCSAGHDFLAPSISHHHWKYTRWSCKRATCWITDMSCRETSHLRKQGLNECSFTLSTVHSGNLTYCNEGFCHSNKKPSTGLHRTRKRAHAYLSHMSGKLESKNLHKFTSSTNMHNHLVPVAGKVKRKYRLNAPSQF